MRGLPTPSLADDGPGADGTRGDAGADSSAEVDASTVSDGGEAGTTLITYPDVPGLAPSTHYAFRARLAALEGTDAGWQESFALVTSSSSDGDAGYWTGIADWTNSYTNIAADGPVELEISRVDGTPIQSAATHPVEKATSTQVTGGKAYVTLPGPALVAVDIDGQMDTQDTGRGYSGPPIHTVTLFANPLPDALPDAGDPSVVVVKPGDTPPSTGSWTTLLFAPGVHDIGLGFPVHAGKTYVVPGDAIVYGTILQTTPGDGDDIVIKGYGTLSGARLTQPKYLVPPPMDLTPYQSITLGPAAGAHVIGLTFADPAFHTMQIYGPYAPGKPNLESFIKVLGWRKNGDGVNLFGNVLLTDSFIRTQDDSSYVSGLGIERVVYWNDQNGSAFVLSSLPDADASAPLVVSDCDVIYSRSAAVYSSGGRVFNMRGMGSGPSGSNVIFRDIRVADPRPTLQQFMIAMGPVAPWSDGGTRGPGDMSGVLFQNVSIAAPSVLGQPDVLWGEPDASIDGITFDNLTVDGGKVLSLDHFVTNAYVRNVTFQ